MKSKTLELIDSYYKQLIVEQGDESVDPNMEEDQSNTDSVQDVVEPTPEDTMPLTSEGEEQYISNLIDAALYKPSPEEANTLTNLQSVMQLKRFKNARKEILPTIINIISTSSGSGILKQTLQEIE